MTKKFALLSVPLAVGLTFAGLPSDRLSEEERLWVRLAAIVPGQCTLLCLMDDCNDENEHYAVTDLPVDEYDGGPHDSANCADKVCDWTDPGNGKHPACGGGTEEEQQTMLHAYRIMETAVDRGDVRTIRRLLATAPSVFRINHQREAVQVVGCGEQAVAQYQLSQLSLARIAGDGQQRFAVQLP